MPGFLLHMVSSGEASSELDTMLVKVAEYYSSRLRRTALITVIKTAPITICQKTNPKCW